MRQKALFRLILVVILMSGITAAVLWGTVDVHTAVHLSRFQPWTVLVVLLLMALGLGLDIWRLRDLAQIAGESVSFATGAKAVFGNYGLALFTPGAAGGAVAQVVFLRRAGVSVGKATVLVAARTLLSILFLAACVPVILYFDRSAAPWISERGVIGLVVGLFAGVLTAAKVLKNEQATEAVLRWFQRLPSVQHTLRTFFADAGIVLGMFSSAPAGMLKVLAETGLSLILLYSIVPVLFIGIGADVKWPLVLGRMILLNILLYVAPTPGGSGIAEGGFILLFGSMVPPGTVGVLALAWRLFSEYLPFSIGLWFILNLLGRDFVLSYRELGD